MVGLNLEIRMHKVADDEYGPLCEKCYEEAR